MNSTNAIGTLVVLVGLAGSRLAYAQPAGPTAAPPAAAPPAAAAPTAAVPAPTPPAASAAAPATAPIPSATEAPAAPASRPYAGFVTEPPKEEERSGISYESGGLAHLGLVLGFKPVGLGLSQPFSDLGTSYTGEFELGYLLPPLKRAIEVFLAGQYSAPGVEGKDIADTYGPADASRIPGTTNYSVTVQQLRMTLGGLYRVPLKIPLFRPYVGAGLRMYLTRTKSEADAAGSPFGKNEETATKLGFLGLVGGELHLGPGAVLLEVQCGYASLDGYIMRDTNVGALDLLLGYRLFL